MTRFTAKVYGHTWAGYKGFTEYDFAHQPTRAEVIARAGDFENVTRVELFRTDTAVKRVKMTA